MNKIYLSIIIILFFITLTSCFVAVTRGYENDSLQNRLTNANGNLDLLIKQRGKDYENKLILLEKIKEFEEISTKEKDCFTWTDDISDSLIVKRLRQ